MPSTASAASAPRIAGSASTAAYPLIARCSALSSLVDVGLLRHVGLAVLGLGGAVDRPVPEQRAAAPLLVLERRSRHLQLVDEGGDVGGVGLPEQGHGEGQGTRRERARVYRAGPGRVGSACRPTSYRRDRRHFGDRR